ncbi:MAG: ABC transporter permease [Methanocorpusculum sp.]|jgi:molybdate transport system permease protein|nr:ABC transporter permease [Methanocorpusculum sp.]MDD3257107.1 ABC transporter permease [Methanocorpusculum sp.]MDD4132907.1 ABC transporter permease [Methanocorpusculum sp.]
MIKRRLPTFFQAVCIGISLIVVLVLIAVFLGLILFSSPETLVVCLFSEEIWYAIRLSVITAVISTLLCLIIAVPVAYSMVRFKFFGKQWVNVLLNLPLSLPPLVAGVALLIFLSPATSPAGQFLSSMGIYVVYTSAAIVIAQVFVNAPYMVRIARSTFSMISPRYEHVARTLGCSEVGAFRKITLPMAKNGLIGGLVITWSKAMGEFGAVLMLAGAISMKTETLPIALFLNMSTGDLDMAIAAALILLIISGTALILFEYFGKEHGDVYA